MPEALLGGRRDEGIGTESAGDHEMRPRDGPVAEIDAEDRAEGERFEICAAEIGHNLNCARTMQPLSIYKIISWYRGREVISDFNVGL